MTKIPSKKCDKKQNIRRKKCKSLTEQWKEGTLESGYYYYESKVGVPFIAYQAGSLKYPYDCYGNTVSNVKKVLARVPKFKQLADACEKGSIIRKKLDIAVEALTEIKDYQTDVLLQYWAEGALNKMKGIK